MEETKTSKRLIKDLFYEYFGYSSIAGLLYITIPNKRLIFERIIYISLKSLIFFFTGASNFLNLLIYFFFSNH